MHLTTLLVFSVSLSLSTAIPFRLNPFHHSLTPALHKRGIAGAVYICTDANFLGDCGWIGDATTKCSISGTGSDKPESVGPDPGGFCILYVNQACTGKEIQRLSFPGQASNVPEFGSMKCFVGNEGSTTQTKKLSAKERADRLAGGQGSTRNKKLGEVLKYMESKGNGEGMIGLEKGVYY
jgi:hypothetical protein